MERDFISRKKGVHGIILRKQEQTQTIRVLDNKLFLLRCAIAAMRTGDSQQAGAALDATRIIGIETQHVRSH